MAEQKGLKSFGQFWKTNIKENKKKKKPKKNRREHSFLFSSFPFSFFFFFCLICVLFSLFSFLMTFYFHFCFPSSLICILMRFVPYCMGPVVARERICKSNDPRSIRRKYGKNNVTATVSNKRHYLFFFFFFNLFLFALLFLGAGRYASRKLVWQVGEEMGFRLDCIWTTGPSLRCSKPGKNEKKKKRNKTNAESLMIIC